MTTTLDVLALAPNDVATPLPPWELGRGPGTIGVAVIAGSAADWRAAAARGALLATELHDAPVVTVGVVRDAPTPARATDLAGDCDLVAQPGEVDGLLTALERAGAPALVAAQLLRAPASTIAAESCAYSMLLWSDDFAAWRAGTKARAQSDDGAPRVSVQRDERAWTVMLTRPHKHNAFDARMREELCDALDAIASAPPAPVVIRGLGPSFCSGGDLDEFGSAASPMSAHLVRTGRSVARRLTRLRPRLIAGVHGRCIGAGVEFSAFAGTVIAARTATFTLPELSLGLGLGAGGSASIPARIGRRRTLALLVDGHPIDAATALSWGLVDEVIDQHELEARCRAAAEELA